MAIDACVLIGTFNRCRLLEATLDSLARVQASPDLRWEVLIVDNNSSDGTRALVENRQRTFPVPLRYLFESRQGKAQALNSGLAASSAGVIALTDDDVEVEPGWLEAGVRPLLLQDDIHYTGGPVLPLWESAPPPWVQAESAVFRGPLALLDYGAEGFVFEDRRRIPIGANMAVRRSAIAQVGGFHVGLDRRGATLMGQGQAEFFFRTRAAGMKGLYVPAMRVRHHVPTSRLNARYHRRWWYWKGVARGRMQDWHTVTELGLDLTAVPRLLGLPRFMWRSAAEDAGGWVSAWLRRDTVSRLEREVKLAYVMGYVAGRRATRLRRDDMRPAIAASRDGGPSAGVAAQTPVTELRR